MRAVDRVGVLRRGENVSGELGAGHSGTDHPLDARVVLMLIHNTHAHGLISYANVREIDVSKVTNHDTAYQRVCVIAGSSFRCEAVQFLP